MKTRNLFLALVCVGVLTAIIFATQAQSSGAKALVGTWKVRLTPGDPATAQFDELMTFADGGGIVESNNFPFFTLGLAIPGPGQGTWSHTGSQEFAFTFIKFLYAPNGAAAGTLKVVGTLDYSTEGDTWSGPAAVSICDNQASNCFQIDTTEGAATRITTP